jgi:serine/threonine-protein kinase mTOR
VYALRHNCEQVSGIEGNFRTTCTRVMGVLRENRDSLIAMLEAFVHDPLISWRLLRAATEQRSPDAAAAAAAAAVAAAAAQQQQQLGPESAPLHRLRSTRHSRFNNQLQL